MLLIVVSGTMMVKQCRLDQFSLSVHACVCLSAMSPNPTLYKSLEVFDCSYCSLVYCKTLYFLVLWFFVKFWPNKINSWHYTHMFMLPCKFLQGFWICKTVDLWINLKKYIIMNKTNIAVYVFFSFRAQVIGLYVWLPVSLSDCLSVYLFVCLQILTCLG